MHQHKVAFQDRKGVNFCSSHFPPYFSNLTYLLSYQISPFKKSQKSWKSLLSERTLATIEIMIQSPLTRRYYYHLFNELPYTPRSYPTMARSAWSNLQGDCQNYQGQRTHKQLVVVMLQQHELVACLLIQISQPDWVTPERIKYSQNNTQYRNLGTCSCCSVCKTAFLIFIIHSHQFYSLNSTFQYFM